MNDSRSQVLLNITCVVLALVTLDVFIWAFFKRQDAVLLAPICIISVIIAIAKSRPSTLGKLFPTILTMLASAMTFLWVLFAIAGALTVGSISLVSAALSGGAVACILGAAVLRSPRFGKKEGSAGISLFFSLGSAILAILYARGT